ncbi:MAG: PLP-dependent transferase [Leptospiraceae bacterium]|nr:PLP-dependent transferase [Leptospiraceae bacterium]MCP5501477.1 PLP-dependent transferase [Leptospiraceae bacterium]
MKMDTKFVHGAKSFESVTGSISTPIYQSATFKHPALYESTGYDYSRTLNPTREKLEETYALLESGTHGSAFSCGMAAITAIFELFQFGDHILVGDDIYGGTYRFFQDISSKRNLEFSYINTTSLKEIEKNIKPNTKAIFLETPTNPMMKVSDIQSIQKLVKPKNILLIVDNTFLSPYFQRPIELGADIVVSSGTKYLAGHNDTLSGLVASANSELGEKIQFIQNNTGAVLSPFDSWLTLRGIKTLGIRMRKQEENSIELANFLKEHPAIAKVYYIGLPEHPSYELSRRQASGFGAMLSFEVKDPNLVPNLLKRIMIISFAESLGGVESLLTYPIVQTHNALPEATLHKLGINDRLLRFSVGIEDVEDLKKDLEQALSDKVLSV